MSKHDMLKAQTCVLRVNIHCEGCMHKVKKKLQKVDGVYKVNIDSEQGRVIVSGNADPASLIEKLEKAGKHAELWGGPQKPVPVFITNDQLKKFQMEKNGKNKGNHEHKNGNGFPQIHHEKGFKDDKLFSAKDQKSVRFNLPEDDEFDDDDEFDEEDDEFDDDDEFYDDESDDEFGEGGFDGHKPPAKAAAANGVGHKASKAVPNAHHKGEKEGKPKKGGGGGGIDVFLKGMFRKAGGRKKGDSDKKSKKEDKKKDDNGKNGGKKGGFELGDLKKGKNDDGRSKKGGEGFDGGKQQQHQQQQMFNEMMKANHKGGVGGGGGGGGGRNMMDQMMGQTGSFPAVAGMPAMNGGRFMAGPGNNPYSQQQQYMAHMMMMNQQRENGHGAYHPSAYAGPPQPAMSYGPQPGMMYGAPAPPMSYGRPTEPYTNMFSDENTDSCSIM